MLSAQGASNVSRAWAYFLVVARIVALIALGQFAGVNHLIADTLDVAVLGSVEHEDHEQPCPVDRPCDDCPPGCPNCHCPNTLRSLAAGADFEVGPALGASSAGLCSRKPAAPSDPDLPSLYRPPRNQSSVG